MQLKQSIMPSEKEPSRIDILIEQQRAVVEKLEAELAEERQKLEELLANREIWIEALQKQNEADEAIAKLSPKLQPEFAQEWSQIVMRQGKEKANYSRKKLNPIQLANKIFTSPKEADEKKASQEFSVEKELEALRKQVNSDK